jgi:hypothetical protein
MIIMFVLPISVIEKKDATLKILAQNVRPITYVIMITAIQSLAVHILKSLVMLMLAPSTVVILNLAVGTSKSRVMMGTSVLLIIVILNLDVPMKTLSATIIANVRKISVTLTPVVYTLKYLVMILMLVLMIIVTVNLDAGIRMLYVTIIMSVRLTNAIPSAVVNFILTIVMIGICVLRMAVIQLLDVGIMISPLTMVMPVL